MMLQRALCAAAFALHGYAASPQDFFNYPQAPKDSAILNSTTDAFIRTVLSDWNTPGGVGVAVVRLDPLGDWLVETRGYGNATVSGDVPLTEDSMFAIASNSKLFTALATGLLISNESLSVSWDSKIASLVPGWELQDPIASAESNIIDLACHRTGLPRHDLMYGRKDNITSILSRFRFMDPSAGFRETWQYNNNMYMLLSYLPEVLLPHRPTIVRFVKENILDPLGMSGTTYSGDVARASGHYAQGMERAKMDAPFAYGTPHALQSPNYWLGDGEDGNYKSGAGGVVMSVKDAATWLQTLLLRGKNPKTLEQVIPEEVIKTVSRGFSVAVPDAAWPELSPVVYGAGQEIYSYRGHEIIEHGGSTTGFMTQIARFPNDNVGIAVFSNDENYGGALHEIIKWYLADIIFGLEPVDWNTRLQAQARSAFEQTANKFRPADPAPPSKPFGTLEGIYSNPAYGELHLCWIAPHAMPKSSPGCGTLSEELSWALPGAVNSSVSTYIAKWDKAWSTHIMLEHFSENMYNVTLLESRLEVGPEEKYWAAVTHEGAAVIAEFAFEDDDVSGFGLSGGIWGAGAAVPPRQGKTIRQRSEIWYSYNNST